MDFSKISALMIRPENSKVKKELVKVYLAYEESILSSPLYLLTVLRAHLTPRESRRSEIFWSERAPFSAMISAIMSLTTFLETLYWPPEVVATP